MLGEVLGSPQGVDEKQGAKPLALDRAIHRQASKEHDGYIQPWQTLRLFGREGLVCDAVVGNGIETQYDPGTCPRGDVGASQVALLELASP